jgi:single-stranded DNA-binding protein
VAVVVRLRLNEWTTKDGERRSRVQIVADAVQFLGAPTKAAKPAAEPDDTPADRPAVGAYRRKAGQVTKEVRPSTGGRTSSSTCPALKRWAG